MTCDLNPSRCPMWGHTPGGIRDWNNNHHQPVHLPKWTDCKSLDAPHPLQRPASTRPESCRNVPSASVGISSVDRTNSTPTLCSSPPSPHPQPYPKRIFFLLVGISSNKKQKPMIKFHWPILSMMGLDCIRNQSRPGGFIPA